MAKSKNNLINAIWILLQDPIDFIRENLVSIIILIVFISVVVFGLRSLANASNRLSEERSVIHAMIETCKEDCPTKTPGIHQECIDTCRSYDTEVLRVHYGEPTTGE